MKDLEYRHYTGLEFKAENEIRKMTGYAAVFNTDSVDFGWFKEQIAPGAFTRTLKEHPDVRAFVDHDPSKIIGRTKSKTLILRQDDHGLFAEIEPANTTVGNDVYESVKRGDIDGMSFGFRVISDKWEMRDGKEFRTILDVDLKEVSIVTLPAYQDTNISARSAEKAWQEHCKAVKNGIHPTELKRRIALFEKIG